MKYRHCDGKLVLKVTNDRVVRLATHPTRATAPHRAWLRAVGHWPRRSGH